MSKEDSKENTIEKILQITRQCQMARGGTALKSKIEKILKDSFEAQKKNEEK